MNNSQLCDLKGELADKFEFVIVKLFKIWDEIGISEVKRDERLKVVMLHLETLLEEMLSEEENLKSTLINSVSKCTDQVQDLCQQLSLSPYTIDESLSLLKLECTLREKTEELSKVKEQRLKKFKDLMEYEVKLCQCLSMPQLVLGNDESAIPSMKDLDELQQHVSMLSDEKIKRQESLYSMRDTIKELMQYLEYSPSSQLECELLCEDSSSLTLSSVYLTEVQNLLEMLKKIEADNKKEAENLVEYLEALWNRLEIDEIQRNEFLMLNSGYKPSTILALKNEISRCEKLKSQNLHTFMCKVRDELMHWWEKCFISQDQRDKFAYFFEDTFSDELLNIHECEVMKMKDYYNTHKDMFCKVEKREELWENMIQFEKNALDPKRFNNRGCGLLEEEKERKKLLIKLPKLEEELKLLINEWELRQAKPFLVNGMRFIEYIEQQWQQFKQGKENEKIERKRVRAKQLEREAIHGIKSQAVQGKRLGACTPTGTPKRLRANITTNTLSKQKSMMASRCGTPIRNNLTPIQKKGTPLSSKSVLREKNVINDSGFSVTTISGMHKPSDNTFASSMASYTEFTEDLNAKTREYCRSSMVSPAIRSTKKRPQTPIRRSPRLSIRKTPRTPSSIKKSPGKYLSKNAKSPGTPLRHNLGLPFLI